MQQTPVLYSPPEDEADATNWRGQPFIRGAVTHLSDADHIEAAKANPHFIVGSSAIRDAFEREEQALEDKLHAAVDALKTEFRKLHDAFVVRKEAAQASIEQLSGTAVEPQEDPAPTADELQQAAAQAAEKAQRENPVPGSNPAPLPDGAPRDPAAPSGEPSTGGGEANPAPVPPAQ